MAKKTKTEEKLEAIETLPKHLVLYTDGGCHPSSRGFAGAGIHGYVFVDQTPTQGAGAKQTPTSKGYDSDNGKPVEIVEYLDWWEGIPGESTSNVGELRAAIKAYRFIIAYKAETALLLLDSEYVLNGLKGDLLKWKNNNWIKSDGKRIQNFDYWVELDQLKEKAEAICKVDTDWVKGHSGNLGNHCADTAATRGCICSLQGDFEEHCYVTPAKGYWSNKSTYNRIISKSRWYFNANRPQSQYMQDGKYVYHLGKHGDDDTLFGKRMSDTSFSVVFLKEPEPGLELIRQCQSNITPDGFEPIVIAKVDAIVNPRIYNDVIAHSGKYLYQRKKERDLYTAEKIIVSRELEQPYISQKGIEQLVDMGMILTKFINAGKVSDGHHIATDITDILYDSVEKKGEVVSKKLKKEITVSSRVVEVPIEFNTRGSVETVKQKLLLDMDLPGRNTLSSLSEANLKVFVLTWMESDCSFRYATIVEHGDDIGIWSTAYSNLRLVK